MTENHAFASRSMTDIERHYYQIEKEALALIWACEKFQGYVLGKHIDLETDHKPLVPLMSTTSLDSLRPAVQTTPHAVILFHLPRCC